MLDGNQRLTEPQALQIAAAIERLGFAWFEESIPQNDIAGYTRLNAALAIRVAGDEQWSTGQQLRPYLEPRAYAIVQPDAGWCGIRRHSRSRRWPSDIASRCARTIGTIG